MLEGLPIGPQLSAWIILFMLIVARLTFVVFLMPGIGDQTVPMRVRMSLLLGVATLFAMSGIVTAPVDISIANFVGLLGAETIIGLGLGVLLATGLIPASWAIGDGKYAMLLGVNAYGFLICTAGFFVPLVVRRLAGRSLAAGEV